ncbi:hypothetical protein, partial [Thermovenabulum sp.]|uniref:hypothetical protein n=1 Tax=Thermovenabulum sp. TaxID=3100335 RepID=UPI003C7DA3D1
MKKFTAILLILLLILSFVPSLSLAEVNNFTISVEKNNQDADYLEFIITSETLFTKIYYAIVNEAAYGEIDDNNIDIIGFLKGTQQITLKNDDSCIITKGTFNPGQPTTIVPIFKSKYYLKSYIDEANINKDELYFLCLAEGENSVISNYIITKINRNDVEVDEQAYQSATDALKYIESRILINKNATINLLDIIDKKDQESNKLINKFFENIEGKNINNRLKNLGIDAS